MLKFLCKLVNLTRSYQRKQKGMFFSEHRVLLYLCLCHSHSSVKAANDIITQTTKTEEWRLWFSTDKTLSEISMESPSRGNNTCEIPVESPSRASKYLWCRTNLSSSFQQITHSISKMVQDRQSLWRVNRKSCVLQRIVTLPWPWLSPITQNDAHVCVVALPSCLSNGWS